LSTGALEQVIRIKYKLNPMNLKTK
jgi:hypothetical protein